LQSDGIPSQEISSASNIMAISSPHKNPNSQHCIDFDRISHGMMLYIIGKNRNPLLMVIYLSYVSKLKISHFTQGLPLQRPSKKHAPKGHWLDLANSKQFFIEFAQERGFDPLSAEDWNTVTRREIYAKKVNSLPPVIQLTSCLHLFRAECPS